MKEVYVVNISDVCDYEESGEIEVWETYELAKERKNFLRDSLLDDIGDIVNCYDNIEDTESRFSIYNEGEYNFEHYTIEIIKTEVRGK